MAEKKPRLVYFEEGERCWCPAPEKVSEIIDLECFLRPDDQHKIRFKRVDMTDEEWANLQEI